MVRIRAPEIAQDFPWLNVEQPLSLKSLRGQVVLLDFWTYGCINCLHVIPDLHYLEQKHSHHLTIVGVHTAKFAHEQDLGSIEQAILRYEINHPVGVDCDRTFWDHYAIRAYPTFVVIDLQGYIAATTSGEGQRHTLDNLIQQLIEEHEGKGTLNQSSVQSILKSQTRLNSPVCFGHSRSANLEHPCGVKSKLVRENPFISGNAKNSWWMMPRSHPIWDSINAKT